MGGAPPLPHSFAPEGSKNITFLTPGGRFQEGPSEGRKTWVWEPRRRVPVASGRPPWSVGGGLGTDGQGTAGEAVPQDTKLAAAGGRSEGDSMTAKS